MSSAFPNIVWDVVEYYLSYRRRAKTRQKAHKCGETKQLSVLLRVVITE